MNKESLKIIKPAIAIAVIAQFVWSSLMMHSNYFNDDLEPLARAVFFSELYKTQFSVHMPLHAMIAAVWVSVFGATWEANRYMAAFLNVPTIVLIIYWIDLVRQDLVGKVIALAMVALYLLLQVETWGYLNLASLCASFFISLALLICIKINKDTQEIFVVKPIIFGILLGCVIFSRVMNVVQVLLIAFALIILESSGKREKIRVIFHSTLGAVTLSAIIACFFFSKGVLADLYYWTVEHNIKFKSGSFSPMAWVGNLTSPSMQALYVAWALLIMSFGGYLLFRRHRSNPPDRLVILALMTATGGWISANPTGIGDIAFHAIPAIGGICLTMGMCLAGMAGQFIEGSDRDAKPVLGAMALGSVFLLLAMPLVGMVKPFSDAVRHIEASNASKDRRETEKIGAYIRRNTSPDETIFSFGTNPYLYVTSARGSATSGSILYRELVPYQDRLIAELRASKPIAVVLFRDFHFKENWENFPTLVAYIIANYRASSSIENVLWRKDHQLASSIINVDQRDVERLAPALKAQGCDFSFLTSKSGKVGRQARVLTYQTNGEWLEAEELLAEHLQASVLQGVFRLRFRYRLEAGTRESVKPFRVLLKLDNGGLRWTWVVPPNSSQGVDHIVELSGIDFVHSSEAASAGAKVRSIQFGGWQASGVGLQFDEISVSASLTKLNCS